MLGCLALRSPGSWVYRVTLCEALAERGWRVTCLDDLSTGWGDNISHPEGKGFYFVEGDVRDSAILEELTKSIDALFRLAAMVYVISERHKAH